MPFVQPEIWNIRLGGLPISHFGGYSNHEPLRPRKLLLHRREIDKLRVKIEQKGLTVVPLKIYFNEQGRVKCELALARGKHTYDKRETIKRREADRDAGRSMRHHGRG